MPSGYVGLPFGHASLLIQNVEYHSASVVTVAVPDPKLLPSRYGDMGKPQCDPGANPIICMESKPSAADLGPRTDLLCGQSGKAR